MIIPNRAMVLAILLGVKNLKKANIAIKKSCMTKMSKAVFQGDFKIRYSLYIKVIPIRPIKDIFEIKKAMITAKTACIRTKIKIFFPMY